MTVAEQNEKLLELIGDRCVTISELVKEGACIIVGGMVETVRHRLNRMVADGRLRKVKMKHSRLPVGGRQFGSRQCLHGYKRVGAKAAAPAAGEGV